MFLESDFEQVRKVVLLDDTAGTVDLSGGRAAWKGHRNQGRTVYGCGSCEKI